MKDNNKYVCCFCGKSENINDNMGFAISIQPMKSWRENLNENIQGFMCHSECLNTKFKQILDREAAQYLIDVID